MRTAEDLQDELNRSEKSRAELVDKLTTKAGELGEARAESQRHKDRADAAERGAADAQRHLDALNRQTGELNAANAAVARLEAEAASMRKALNDAAAAIATLNERIGQAQAQLNASAEEAGKYRAAHDRKQAVLSSIFAACLNDANKLA